MVIMVIVIVIVIRVRNKIIKGWLCHNYCNLVIIPKIKKMV